MLEFSRGANRNVETWDQNIFQGTTPSCAVRCQQIIMRDYGIQIPQEDLMDYAAQKGWYNPEDGTMTKDIGNHSQHRVLWHHSYLKFYLT